MAEGTEVGTAYVSILPSAAGFGAKLQSQITGEAGEAGQKAGQALGAGLTGQASSIARNIGGVFAAVGAARFLKGSVAEAEDAARVGRLTESVIRSTGAAAGVTQKQVEDLAASLSKVAGIDDELVQAGENVLLTFTKVRNQAGRGNDVFTQATTAALDLSVALGTDLQGAVIQLGKALNDPVAGMTALTRSGVSFTEQQKDQIKALQRSGDLLGAQKIILAEVNKEFGGAAAAGKTALGELDVAIGNLQEAIGGALLPAVEAGSGALTGMLGMFTSLPAPIQTAGVALAGLGAGAVALGLVAPKIAAARLELEGMGAAGLRASTALGVLGKVGGYAVGFLLLASILKSLNGELDDAPARVKGFAKMTADELGKAIVTEKDFKAVLDSGNLALGDRILAMGKANGNPMTDWQRLYDAALAKGRAFSADQTNTAKLLSGPLTDGLEQVTTGLGSMNNEVDEAKQKWDELRGQLEEVVTSDFSSQLASNLTSALNPLERFVAGSGENIGDLKEQVTGAADTLAKAKADLAKLQQPAAGDDVEQFLTRGHEATAADLDAARHAVDKAAVDMAKAQANLAEAQKSPLRAIEDNQRANLNLVTSWLANLQTLSSGGHESLAKHLGALGPEAADAVAEAVGVSPKQLDKLEGMFVQADKKISDAASGVFELNLDQAAKPGETLAEIIADRYQKSLTPKFTKATLQALHDATAAILAAEKSAVQAQAAAEAAELHARNEERGIATSGSATTAAPVGVTAVTKTVHVTLNGQTPDPTLLGKAIAWEI